MIVSKTPLRISIGGGGSDLPEFYEKMGGFVFSAAITKYIYVAMHKPFDDKITLKYSDIEIVDKDKHPIDTISSKEDAKQDYELGRQTLHQLISAGQEALEGVLDVAKNSD